MINAKTAYDVFVDAAYLQLMEFEKSCETQRLYTDAELQAMREAQTKKNRAKRRRQKLKRPIPKPVRVRTVEEWLNDEGAEVPR